MATRYIGIDVGTQGARCVVVAADGAVLGEGAAALATGQSWPDGRHEQTPDAWWTAVCRASREAMASAGPGPIEALSVSGTSGTLLAIDREGRPLGPALMYNDSRAREEAERANAAAASGLLRLGYRFGASWGLPKLLWLLAHKPESDAWRYVHPADFIMGRLTNRHGVSDYSNALKTGYDLQGECWPDYIVEDLGVPSGLLPEVVRPGASVGQVSAAAAARTGIPAGATVAAGVTDGVAAFFASGAIQPGDANSTLGTTLVLKALAARLVTDPKGRFYSHRHPEGGWIPGGASNVGGECLKVLFPGADLAPIEASIRARPGKVLAYPLVRRGERLPLANPDLEGFVPTGGDPAERLLACLEGVAYVERWAYEEMSALGVPYPERVFSTGGGAKSDLWRQIRADVLGLPVLRPARADSAFGMAVLAASRDAGLAAAAERMVCVESTCTPQLAGPYAESYQRFREECDRRGMTA